MFNLFCPLIVKIQYQKVIDYVLLISHESLQKWSKNLTIIFEKLFTFAAALSASLHFML